jgi:hypothetical protein
MYVEPVAKRARVVSVEGQEVVGPGYLTCMHLIGQDGVE